MIIEKKSREPNISHKHIKRNQQDVVWEPQYWQHVKNGGEMESRVAKVDAFVTSDFGVEEEEEEEL